MVTFLCKEGFACSRTTAEEERSDRGIRIRQTSPTETNSIRNRCHRFSLSDDLTVEILFHVDKFVLFRGIKTRNGDASPTRNQFLNVFRSDVAKGCATGRGGTSCLTFELLLLSFETLNALICLRDR